MITVTMHKYFEGENLKIFTPKYLFTDVMKPLLYASEVSHEKLVLDFDNSNGYPTTILKELIERMVFECSPLPFFMCVDIKSTEDETLPDLIKKWNTDFYIKMSHGELPSWLKI